MMALSKTTKRLVARTLDIAELIMVSVVGKKIKKQKKQTLRSVHS